MDAGYPDEERKILDMIAEGQISADEGEALLEALHHTTVRCAWCAEEIPSGSLECPECHESIGETVLPRVGATSRSLSSLNKILAGGLIFIGAVVLLQNVFHFSLQVLLAVLACSGGVLMFKKNLLGWTLGIAWSALQIVEVIHHGSILNYQLIRFGMSTTTNGSGLGINLVPILFLFLFIRGKNQQKAL